MIHRLVRDSRREPLQKIRVQLGLCKTGLSPSPQLFYITVRSSAVFDISVVVLTFALCFGVEFSCCLNLMYLFIF